MKRNPSEFMKFYGDSFFSSERVMQLTATGERVLMRMLWCQYLDGSCPDCWLTVARIGRISEKEARKGWTEARKFFEVQDGRLVNRRMTMIIADRERVAARARGNGLKGGRPKYPSNQAGCDHGTYDQTEHKPSGFSLGYEAETQREPINKAKEKLTRPGDEDRDGEIEEDLPPNLQSSARSPTYREGGIDPVVDRVMKHFNNESRRIFDPDGDSASFVRARISDGATEDQLLLVLRHRCSIWRQDPRMRRFLRPSTIFAPRHWEDYLSLAVEWEEAGAPDQSHSHTNGSGQESAAEKAARIIKEVLDNDRAN